MKKNAYYIIALSILISVVALAVSCLRIEPVEIDALGIQASMLSLLVTALIGWQIFNYVSFANKVDQKIKQKLHEANENLQKDNEKQLILSFYNSYLTSARNFKDSAMWSPVPVLSNLSFAIDNIVKLEHYDKEIFTPLLTFIEELINLEDSAECFGSNSIYNAKSIDSFILVFRKLLGKDDRIYDLLKKIENQRDNRGDLKYN